MKSKIQPNFLPENPLGIESRRRKIVTDHSVLIYALYKIRKVVFDSIPEYYQNIVKGTIHIPRL